MTAAFDSNAAKRALAREGLSYLAHGLLFPFGFIPPAHEPERRADIRTVVFVHGLGGGRANFFPLQTYLRVLGHKRQLGLNFSTKGGILAMAARLAQALKERVKGGRIDIIAHSLGGLAARYYVQALGGARRVDRLITLGTPHGGSWPAAVVPLRTFQDLRPDSAFVRKLAGLPVPPGVRFTSIAAGNDLLVVPAMSAVQGPGQAMMFPELGHTELLLSPKVMAAVRRALAAE